MIGRLWLLVRKEARQEAWVLLGIALALGALAGLRWLASADADRAPSDMEGAQALIVAFVPIAGLVLGHRLVVREYQARTQLFLESLPLRRSELVLVKYFFGLGVLGVFSLSALGVFAAIAGESSPKFLLIVSLRALGYVSAWWSLFFSVGLLGRLRVPAYITLGLGLLALSYLTSFELARFGPFALIDSMSFSYDRAHVPWRALAQTAAGSLALLVPGVFAALASEGSIAETLSRKATGREVTAVSALLFAEVIGVVWAGTKRPPPPFEFTSAEVVKSENPHVAIMYALPELEPKGRALSRALSALSEHVRKELSVPEWPALSLAQNGLLAGDEVQHSPDSHGMLMLEANLGARDFSATKVLAAVAHAALGQASNGRATFEPNHWLLDGFSTALALETTGENPDQYWLRAAVAVRRLEPREKSVVEWEQTMERLGEDAANALAFALLDFLRQRHGQRRAIDLMRWTLDGHPARISVQSIRLERRFHELTQESFPAFLSAFREDLGRRMREPARAALLASVPNDRAELSVKQGSLGPEIQYAVSGAPLARERRCSLLHGLLRPYDIYYPQRQLKREPFRVEPQASRAEGRLRGRYTTGQRIYAAIECDVPELATRERLRVERFGAL